MNQTVDPRQLMANSITLLAGREKLEQHPLSAAFPSMPEEEFQKLKDSIKAVGIQNPIVLLDDMVLDGWHRYRAGTAVFMRIPCVQLADGIDPKTYVLAQNERRRHLTASQIAVAVVAVHQWTPTGRPKAKDDEKGAPGAPLERTVSELAGIASVSKRTLQQAKFVQSNATPEIQAAVKSGDMSLKAAAATTKKAPAFKKPTKPATAGGECRSIADDTESGQSELEVLQERYNDMAASLKEAIADNESMGKVFDADDKLAAATAEITRLNAQIQVLESRFNGKTNELNEAKHLAKHWKRRSENAEAALSKEAA